MEKLKVSVCIIVKDDAENLELCLMSLKNYFDEIVVVDTGSIDNTIEVAKKFNVSLFNFEWCDDFSKARNFSILKSKNDWILILDSDEVINEINIKRIKDFIKNQVDIVGRIKRTNEIDDDFYGKKYIERVNRFFNRQHYFYVGKIHEQVTSVNGLEYITKDIDISVNHIGYKKEVIDKTKKIERNITLLNSSIKSEPNDPYLHYQLGKSYYLKKDYETAYNSFHKALELNVDTKYEYVEDLIECYGYCMLNLQRYEESLKLISLKEVYSMSADFLFLIGLVYMNNGYFDKAIDEFLGCTKKKGNMYGVSSFLSFYNIGVIYESLGKKQDAIHFYKKAGNYIPAKNRLKLLNKN